MNGFENVYLKNLEQSARAFSEDIDLAPLIDFIGDKKVVMIGESTHGSLEFYQWRNAITQTLIGQYGFNFIAVEGDWPASQHVNNFVKNKTSEDAIQTLNHYDRWPTWMWANTETSEFIDWLKRYNVNFKKSVGFYGLDVYSLFDSMDQVTKILKKIDPDTVAQAEKYFSCLNAFSRDEMTYARSLFKAPEGCKQEILHILEDLLSGRLESKVNSSEEYLDLIQNAKILRHAEDYYRAMIFGEQNSWNVRDQHMLDTLESLLHHFGTGSKGIVWAHNSHIGDYKATEMVGQGDISLGGLAREIFGPDHVALVGMGTNSGAVLAADAWDGPAEIKILPHGKPQSIESHYHELSKKMKSPTLFSLFDHQSKTGELVKSVPHRAVGVVYDPDSDYRRNYVESSMPHRYDAFIYIDETHPIVPIGSHFNHLKFPETYPFGTRL
jgi:erythromycin esterase-like protein